MFLCEGMADAKLKVDPGLRARFAVACHQMAVFFSQGGELLSSTRSRSAVCNHLLEPQIMHRVIAIWFLHGLTNVHWGVAKQGVEQNELREIRPWFNIFCDEREFGIIELHL